MTWKIERWSAEIHRDTEELLREYDALSSRELAVVACAVLDAALAELLSLRLIDDPNECEDFLGLDEDGRAPCGTFGSRIQLAYLTGVLPKRALPLLRGLKELRNAMAHRVKIDLLSAKAQKALDRLRSDLGDGPEFAAAAVRSRTDEESARKLVLHTLAVLSIVLQQEHENAGRLEEVQQDRVPE